MNAYRVRSIVHLLHTLLTASYGIWSLLSVIEIDLNGFMHLGANLLIELFVTVLCFAFTVSTLQGS